ncbi:hypothetical protein Dsin_013629 [Dipteronia sinensis]|uniref:HAT C-terminal dimerisation domain-containing protein n=1 Tax=Dipteronia sinensis TaxID=43782 RepID=A0AAE0ALJ0_9ROSI|nr:hypothetical protein Dsin_013629 [Dipteronia sinensis]
MKGPALGNNLDQISHLQFVDDTILFLEPDLDFVRVAKRILRCFELASSLKINLHKSCLVKVSKRNSLVKEAAEVFRITVGVAKKIEKLQRDFFWGDRMEKRKIHSIDWALVWRFGVEESTLWRIVVCARYGVDPRACSWNWQSGANASHLIKAMSSLFTQNSLSEKLINEGMRVMIGNGHRANFWREIKWDTLPLNIVFPRIFALAQNKSGVVADYGRWFGKKWVWDIQLRTHLFDWEKNQWIGFKAALDCLSIRHAIEDTLVWNFSSNGLFSVRSYRASLEGQLVDVDLFNRWIWNGIFPPKVQNFAWQLMRGRILAIHQVVEMFEMLNTYGKDTILSTAVVAMETKLKKYWSTIPFLYALGLIVDHRVKLSGLDYLLEFIRKNMSIDYSEQITDIRNKLFEVFTIYERRIGGVDTYLDAQFDACEDTEKFDLLLWWKTYSYRYPVMSQLACDVLVIHVSTVSSEQAFSTSRRIIESTRSCLNPEMVEVLTCIRDWEHSRKRLQNETVDEEFIQNFSYLFVDESSGSNQGQN